jgi:broad specificity phosphatase PhoE
MMRRLIIVRHAQSEANAIGSLHCTVPGPPLTDLGQEQAKALADALSGENVQAVWASSMTRAQQTAEPVAAAFNLPLQIRDGFKESFLGELHDRRDDEAHEAFDDIYASWLIGGNPDARCVGGESGTEVLTRWLAALDEVVLSLDRGTAVVVSHGAAARLSISKLARVDPAWVLTHHLPNTGQVVLDESENGWVCRSWAGLRPGE